MLRASTPASARYGVEFEDALTVEGPYVDIAPEFFSWFLTLTPADVPNIVSVDSVGTLVEIPAGADQLVVAERIRAAGGYG